MSCPFIRTADESDVAVRFFLNSKAVFVKVKSKNICARPKNVHRVLNILLNKHIQR